MITVRHNGNREKQMMNLVTFLSLGIISCLCVGVSGINIESVGVDGQSYINVFVALSSQLLETECEAIVNRLETMLNLTNSLVYDMTGERLHYEETIEVVIPESWGKCGDLPISGITNQTGRVFDNAPLRVGNTDPLFGDNMWTQQSGQCTQPGNFVYMTPATLQEQASTTARQFAGEWAKYRWGVMSEVGYLNDSVYPPGYQPTMGIAEYLPTTCTDAPLNFTSGECTSAQDCSPNLDPQYNSNQKSSILSLPNLPNVVSLCTDDTHVATAPTKHNLLCDGRSAWRIFQQHTDYLVNRTNNGSRPAAVTLKLVRESPVKSSVVFVVENSREIADDGNSKSFLHDALCQTIYNYLEDGVYFGLVYFSTNAQQIGGNGELTLLNEMSKKQFCSETDSIPVSKNSTTTRNIARALELAASILPSEGNIMLVALPTSTAENVSQSTVDAAADNKVYPLVYLTDNSNLSWFESLSYQTGTGGVCWDVQLRKSGNSLQATVRQDISQNIMSITNLMQPLQLTLIDSSDCLTNNQMSCEMTLAGNNSVVDGVSPSAFLVSVYSADYPDSVTFEPDNKDCVSFDSGGGATSITYYCPSLVGSVTVTVTISKPGVSVYSYSETVAIFPEPKDYSGLRLWTSQPLRSLEYTSTTAPAVFAQVYVSGRQVLSAKVSAQVWQQETSLANISLTDSGTGADVTGDDGIYSAYLTGLVFNDTSSGKLDQELQLKVLVKSPGTFFPDTLENGTVDIANHCCGSNLVLPPNLDETAEFSFTKALRPRVTTLPVGNLPPGRVTDLSVTGLDTEIGLTFTASGADLDFGTVSGYTVHLMGPDVPEKLFNVTVNLVAAGNQQSIWLKISVTGCDVLVYFSVAAYDEIQSSGASNTVNNYLVPCPGKSNLSAASIVGIVIGVLFLIILIILVCYIGSNWKRRQNLTIFKCLTCNCSKTNEPPESSSNITHDKVQRIKSIHDLHAISRNPHATNKSGTNNGGFDDWTENFRPTSGHSNISYSSDKYDLKNSSLQTTLPINRIGIPVDDDDDISYMTKSLPGYLNGESDSIPYTNTFGGNGIPSSYNANPASESPRRTPVSYRTAANSPNYLNNSRLNTQV